MFQQVGIFLLLMTLLSVWTGCSSSSDGQEYQPPIEFEPGQFVSAELCGNCHTDIYSFWKTSVHAQAATSENFRTAMKEASELNGTEMESVCLTCHAPARGLTPGLENEGVGCDFCHSVTGINLSARENSFVMNVSDIKYGPVQGAASTGHKVQYSEFHKDSKHCAGCHEYRSAEGVELLSTYSEWEAYKANGGTKTCQECHMPLVLANVVDPKIKRIQHSFVNLHSMPGGHSRDQLTKALRLKIMEMSKREDGLFVKVQVTNVGAGHMVPTGSPSRRVILNVDVSTEAEVYWHDEVTYWRTVVDEEKQPILREARLFGKGVTVAADNRIHPGEVRTEEFLFKAPQNQNLKITAGLTYVYSPHGREETETRIDFLSETRKLLSTWTRQN